MTTLPYAARYLMPIRREYFPIWRYGPLPIADEGWYPDWYTQKEISREEAIAICDAQTKREMT